MKKIRNFCQIILLRCFILFMVLVIGTGSFAQVRGTVLGCDGKPLEGAIVLAMRANAASVADSRGQFQVVASPDDSLLVSCVGFKPDTVSARSDKPLVIRLGCVMDREEEVVVRKYLRKGRIGRDPGRQTVTFFFGSSWQVCIRLDNSKQTWARIKRLHLYLKNGDLDSSGVLTIGFREIDSVTGKPGAFINPDTISVRGPFLKKMVVPVTAFTLIPPGGCFVSMIYRTAPSVDRPMRLGFVGHSFGEKGNLFMMKWYPETPPEFVNWLEDDHGATVYLSADILY